MRVGTFDGPAGAFAGLVVGDGVVDASRHLDGSPGMAEILAGGEADRLAALSGRNPDYALADVRFLPPVTAPAKIFTVIGNYESVRLAQGRPKLKYPHLTTRFADTLAGHECPLRRPAHSAEFDYEGELAVVIGKGGRHIPRERAMAHVGGYACFNDATARDWMRHTRHFTAGKNFPRTAGFGPWLTTPDEMGDLASRSIETRVNGEVRQQASLGDFTFPIDELIAYISTFTMLAPGDVIATGSPGGAGFKLKPPRFLAPGDRVEVAVDGIGVLANPVLAEDEGDGQSVTDSA